MNKKPDKLAFFKQCYDAIDSVYILFDPTHPWCQVPESIKDRPVCKFVYGRNIALPTHDMDATILGIRATLGFQGRPFMTFVPWAAVSCVFFIDFDGTPRGTEYPLAPLPASLGKKPAPLPSPPVKKPASAPPPKQLGLVSGAKIYNFEEERARRASKGHGPKAS